MDGQELIEKVLTAIDERRTLEARWTKWSEQYEGKTKPKNFPWPKASNVHVALTSVHVDAMYARIMGMLFHQRPIVSVRPLRPEAVEEARALEEFLEVVGRNPLELNAIVSLCPWILTICKMGVGFLKIVYAYGSPRFINISPKDLIIPPYTTDLQTCDWVAHRVRLTEAQLKERARTNFYDREVVEQMLKSSKQPDAEEVESLEGKLGISVREGLYEVYEVWVRNENDENEVWWLTKEGQELKPHTTNPYKHGLRPFVSAPYMPREDSIYGIGIPEMLEHIQEEVNTIHNQRRDNATLANIKCFKARRGRGIKSPLELYPGAVIWVDDPNDIQEFFIGQAGVSASMAEEAQVISYGERRTGISDYSLGMEAIARPTASGTLALIQEGNRRFEIVTLLIRPALAEAYMQAVQLYQQYYPEGKAFLLMGEKGEAVERLMRFPEGNIRERLWFEIVASSASLNRDIE